MERKITINDLQNAVSDAYNEYKELDKGAIDPRVAATAKPGAFAVTVVLADGRKVECGDTTVRAALGNIVNIPVHAVLLQQLGVKELIKKAGKTCNCALRQLDLPVCPHTLRAVSAVQPTGDHDGKYDVIADTLVGMLGSEPVLDDKLYETLTDEAQKADVVNKVAEAGYDLYDATAPALDDLLKLESLTVTTTQLATLGATIAADGVCPANETNVFDGTLSAPLVTIAAVHGRPDRNRRWLLKSGVPAVFSFAGMVLAIMPGVGAIAAYAPEVGKHGRSKKGARAIRAITQKIGYNVFGSARIVVE